MPGVYAGQRGLALDRSHSDAKRGAEAGVGDDGPLPSRWTFTLALTEDEAGDIARGVVPPAVQDAVIGLLRDTGLSPAEAVTAMNERRHRGA